MKVFLSFRTVINILKVTFWRGKETASRSRSGQRTNNHFRVTKMF